MKIPHQVLLACIVSICVLCGKLGLCHAQDYDVNPTPAAPPPEQEDCDGIFVSYNFISREKEYPHVKNASAQAWAFKSVATVLNAGVEELKAWKIFIGFQHEEILVGASGAVTIGGEDFPAKVGNNGTYLAGYPQADLKTAIETAGDYNQMQVKIELTGTQFGVKPSGVPMPKTIKLVNDGYKCPAPHHHGMCAWNQFHLYVHCLQNMQMFPFCLHGFIAYAPFAIVYAASNPVKESFKHLAMGILA